MSEPIKAHKEDIVVTKHQRVSCDGPDWGKHPRVYLNINDGETFVVCPYCSRTFQYTPE